jgi:hypothetical protein
MRARQLTLWPAVGVLACAVLFSSCCSIVGFFRYGLTQSSFGYLDEGDVAPDLALFTLDGVPVRLLYWLGERPWVLILGCFT